jgi:hypothetical protein
MRKQLLTLVVVIGACIAVVAQKPEKVTRRDLRNPHYHVNRSLRNPRSTAVGHAVKPGPTDAAQQLTKLEQSMTRLPAQSPQKQRVQQSAGAAPVRPLRTERNVSINFPAKTQKPTLTAQPSRGGRRVH